MGNSASFKQKKRNMMTNARHKRGNRLARENTSTSLYADTPQNMASALPHGEENRAICGKAAKLAISARISSCSVLSEDSAIEIDPESQASSVRLEQIGLDFGNSRVLQANSWPESTCSNVQLTDAKTPSTQKQHRRGNGTPPGERIRPGQADGASIVCHVHDRVRSANQLPNNDEEKCDQQTNGKHRNRKKSASVGSSSSKLAVISPTRHGGRRLPLVSLSLSAPDLRQDCQQEGGNGPALSPMPVIMCERKFKKFMIDHDGGMLSFGDGINLFVPTFAVSEGETRDILIGTTTNTADMPNLHSTQRIVSPVVQIGPQSIRFEQAVLLSFPHTSVGSGPDADKHLHILHSETAVGEATRWRIWQNSETGDPSVYGMVTSTRCVLSLNRFCLFVVIEEDRRELTAKAFKAMLFADSILTRSENFVKLTLCCVYHDDAASAMQRVGGQNVGFMIMDQPLVMYDNKKDICAELISVKDSWSVKHKDECKKTLSSIQIWENLQPSCTFVLKSDTGNKAYTETSQDIIFACKLRVYQEKSEHLPGTEAIFEILQSLNKINSTTAHAYEATTSTVERDSEHRPKDKLCHQCRGSLFGSKSSVRCLNRSLMNGSTGSVVEHISGDGYDQPTHNISSGSLTSLKASDGEHQYAVRSSAYVHHRSNRRDGYVGPRDAVSSESLPSIAASFEVQQLQVTSAAHTHHRSSTDLQRPDNTDGNEGGVSANVKRTDVVYHLRAETDNKGIESALRTTTKNLLAPVTCLQSVGFFEETEEKNIALPSSVCKSATKKSDTRDGPIRYGVQATAEEPTSNVQCDLRSAYVYTGIKNHRVRRNEIPFQLESDLSLLLDPPHPLNYDWRLLASTMDLSEFIPLFEYNKSSISPTSQVLRIWQSLNLTLDDLKKRLADIKRPDTVQLIENYQHTLEANRFPRDPPEWV